MSTSEAPAPRRRRRGAELIEAIQAAALAEATEAGIAGMTMEGIARRAGTAKTSLYRRWPAPTDILLDALHDAFPREEPSPAADDLRGDLIRALGQLTEWMSTPTAQVAYAVITARNQFPELAHALYERVFDAHGGRVTLTVLRHYAAHGVIDPDVVTPAVADIGEAMVSKIFLDAARVPNADELEAIVDQVILPALGAGMGGSSGSGSG